MEVARIYAKPDPACERVRHADSGIEREVRLRSIEALGARHVGDALEHREDHAEAGRRIRTPGPSRAVNAIRNNDVAGGERGARVQVDTRRHQIDDVFVAEEVTVQLGINLESDPAAKIVAP